MAKPASEPRLTTCWYTRRSDLFREARSIGRLTNLDRGDAA